MQIIEGKYGILKLNQDGSYTYEITNYPTGETGILANLLIYKNTVIGGEVLSPQLDGFLHGLAMP